MSFVGWAAIATLGGAAVKTVGAYQSGKAAKAFDSKKAEELAEEIRDKEEALLRKETASKLRSAKSQYELATESISNQVTDTNLAVSDSLLKTFSEQSYLSQKGGFAGSGQLDTMTSDSYRSARKIGESAIDKLAIQQKGSYESMVSTLTGVDIFKEKSLAAIGERFDARIAEIAATPDTFFEGIFGSDYKTG